MRHSARDRVVRPRPVAPDLDIDDDDTGLTPRVLLVDPHGAVREAIGEHLPAQTEISSTESVQRAMPRIENEPFDLVVCAIDTQGMEQLLRGAARVAFLDGERIVALNGVAAPATTSTPDLRQVLAHVLNANS